MKRSVSANYGKMAMFACLMVCTLTNTATLVSPVMGSIMETYLPQGYSATTIKLVLSLPKLTSFLMTLLSLAVLIDRFDNKWLGVASIAGVGIFGGMGYFAEDFEFLLLTRALMGASFGIAAPLFAGYLGRLWSGDEFKRLIGLKETFASADTIVDSLLVGLFAAVYWRGAFLRHVLDLVIALLVAIFVPSMPAPTREEREAAKARKRQARAEAKALSSDERIAADSKRKKLLLLAAAFFALYVVRFGYYTNLTLCITEAGLGGTGAASIASSIRGIAAAVAGIFYKEIYDLLKKYHLPSALLLVGAGMLIIGKGSSLLTIYIGTAVFGAAWALVSPFFYHAAAANSNRRDSTRYVKKAGVMSVAVDMGSFFSAYILDAGCKALGIHTAAGQMVGSGIFFAAAGVFAAIVFTTAGRRAQANS